MYEVSIVLGRRSSCRKSLDVDADKVEVELPSAVSTVELCADVNELHDPNVGTNSTDDVTVVAWTVVLCEEPDILEELPVIESEDHVWEFEDSMLLALVVFMNES